MTTSGRCSGRRTRSSGTRTPGGRGDSQGPGYSYWDRISDLQTFSLLHISVCTENQELNLVPPFLYGSNITNVQFVLGMGHVSTAIILWCLKMECVLLLLYYTRHPCKHQTPHDSSVPSKSRLVSRWRRSAEAEQSAGAGGAQHATSGLRLPVSRSDIWCTSAKQSKNSTSEGTTISTLNIFVLMCFSLYLFAS